MQILMEIRPGEGGDDAKRLVDEQAALYVRHAQLKGARVQVERRGHL